MRAGILHKWHCLLMTGRLSTSTCTWRFIFHILHNITQLTWPPTFTFGALLWHGGIFRYNCFRFFMDSPNHIFWINSFAVFAHRWTGLIQMSSIIEMHWTSLQVSSDSRKTSAVIILPPKNSGSLIWLLSQIPVKWEKAACLNLSRFRDVLYLL